MEETYIVNESSSEIRLKAREALRGNWKDAFVVVLMYMIVLLLPYSILFVVNDIFNPPAIDDGILTVGDIIDTIPLIPSNFADIYACIIIGSLNVGLCAVALAISREVEYSIATIFIGFKIFLKTFGLYIAFHIIMRFGLIFLVIPGVIFFYMFSMIFFVMAENPKVGIIESFEKSQKIMVGNKAGFFLLQVSFIGWGLVCAVVFFVVGSVGMFIIGNFLNMHDTIIFDTAFEIWTAIIAIPIITVFCVYYQTAVGVFYNIATGRDKVKVENTLQNQIDQIEGKYTV